MRQAGKHRTGAYLEADAAVLVELDEALVYWQRARAGRQAQDEVRLVIGRPERRDSACDIVADLHAEGVLLRENVG